MTLSDLEGHFAVVLGLCVKRIPEDSSWYVLTREWNEHKGFPSYKQTISI